MAIATSKSVVNLPEFTGKDLSAFGEFWLVPKDDRPNPRKWEGEVRPALAVLQASVLGEASEAHRDAVRHVRRCVSCP